MALTVTNMEDGQYPDAKSLCDTGLFGGENEI